MKNVFQCGFFLLQPPLSPKVHCCHVLHVAAIQRWRCEVRTAPTWGDPESCCAVNDTAALLSNAIRYNWQSAVPCALNKLLRGNQNNCHVGSASPLARRLCLNLQDHIATPTGCIVLHPGYSFRHSVCNCPEDTASPAAPCAEQSLLLSMIATNPSLE